jgi:UPF0755 protein
LAKKRRKRLLGGLVALLIPVAIGVVAADFVRFWHGPLRPGAPQQAVFTIDPGTPVREVATSLARRDLLDRPLYFRMAARATGQARQIQAGEYTVASDTTPYRLLRKFVAGKVKKYQLTVIEGWTFDELRAALRSHEAIDNTLGERDARQVMAALDHPDEHPEGRFFPETYQFPRGITDAELLRRAYQRMERVLAAEWQQRGDNLPLESAYEALILASIIERETGVAEERARIAGVFVERLEQGMRLQTDPTVIYSLGDAFDGDLLARHLRRDTPYNTYTRAGLPPTPIALPSRGAIRAALNPERRGELYFVSTGNGRHVFSRTYEAHRRAVEKYQLNGASP